MRKILLAILLFTVGIVSAQEKNKAEVKDFFWGKNDAFSKANSIPDKWKNESAVIIYKNEFYNFHKFGKSVTYTSAVRKRIKLLDAAAVKEFSEFSFREKFNTNKGFSYKKGTTTVGVKIVKPNGKEIDIDVDKDSKKVDSENKIAIANLEIGDVIDYYYYMVEPFKSYFEVGFEPVEATLGDVYPTMELKLQFETENDFFINFNTYNGAPELKQTVDKGDDRKYELEAKDIPKNDFPRWFYPLAELPCYKFQVFFARSSKFENQAKAFLSEKESVIKKTVSKEDVFNYYFDKFRPFGHLAEVEKFLKGKTFASDEEKVREVYYFARHAFFTKYFEALIVNDAKIFYTLEMYKNPIFINNETEFINYFMAFLKDNKIDYEVIIGTDRNNGPIKDLLIEKNVTLLLKVNTEKPVYLQYFTPFTSADQFNYNLENTEAYALKVTKRKKITDSENITLPSTTAKDNLSKNTIALSVDSDFSSLKVVRESSLVGHFKESEQSDKLEFYNYVNEDYEKYGTESLMDRVKNEKKKAQYSKEFEALVNKQKDKQKENFKKAASEEFGFEVDDHSLAIKNTGRFGSKVPLVYEENFVIKNNLIKKAGENYIIEIGKLITSQVEIDKKEKERKNNVYMAFPRMFENEIAFEIPAGYAVSGIEKLNKKVENETGNFISEAKINGNKLVIKTTKSYKNYFEPNSNWPKMVQFLDAAYQFTQEKILLKKV